MASLVPYTQYNGGAVADIEHERLWSIIHDGVPPAPGVEASSFGVSLSGGQWHVAPGTFLIAGHLLTLTSGDNRSGNPPGNPSQPIQSLVYAFIDHSKTPWTYGVSIKHGVQGGGLPSMNRSLTGRYEVALRELTTGVAGATSLGDDRRIQLERVGKPQAVYPQEWDNISLRDPEGWWTYEGRTPRSRFIGDDLVEIRGSANYFEPPAVADDSNGNKIGRLAAKYWPSSKRIYAGGAGLGSASFNNAGAFRLEIETDGWIRVYSKQYVAWVALDHIYRTD